MTSRVAARSMVNGGYIAGFWYDHTFFILAPLFAVIVGFAAVQLGGYGLRLSGRSDGGVMLQVALPTYLSAAFTHAHLLAVAFRSHGNPRIFGAHRLRFTVVPVFVLAATMLSSWAFALASVAVVWWDVYHSSLQTFGLGRLYDQRRGNDPRQGRGADWLFNLLIYVGPVVAGVHLAPHLAILARFDELGTAAPSALAAAFLARHDDVRRLVLGIGLPGVAVYVWHYVRLARSGYRVPTPKIVLLVSTALCSIAAWGFGSFGEAFLIMNFFHAWQYFGLVWWVEKSTVSSRLGGSIPLALGVLVGVTMVYGLWRAWEPWHARFTIALGNVISLMHFWYDGFIWSVQRKQVP
jgi:hypothetical protein